MTSAVTPGVFFLMVLAAGPPCQARQCRLPLPGKCSTSNYTIEDGTVCPAAKADCNFTTAEGLCDYRQGCRESLMTNWTVENGAVKANQTTAGSCSSADFYYSALESPWLEFTKTSCLQFRYKRYTPAALDVFLALHNGSVLTVLDRNSNTGNGVLSTYNWTVQPGVGKIKFRAYGGGGNGNAEIYSVSVSLGHCGSSGLSTSPYASETSLPSSSLPRNTGVSTGTPPTGGRRLNSDAADDGPGAAAIAGAVVTVVVVIAVVVVVVVIWRRRWRKSATAGGKETGTGSDSSGVKTGGAGVGKGSGQNGNSYTEIPNSHFALAPPSPEGDYAAIDDVTSHTEVGTRHAGIGPYDLPKVTSRDADTKPYDLPKVTSRDADTKPYDLPKVTSRDADTKPNDLAKVTSRDADAKPYDLPKVTSRDAGTKPLDLAKAIPLDEDIDPYEVSEDGAPRKGHSSHGQGLVLTSPHGCPQEKLFPCEDGEGDYSEIGGPQSAPGSHENVSYSQVQKTDKKPDESSPEDEYSVVSKKDNRPEVAVKPGYPKGDYNRINLTGSQAVVLDKTGEATSDPYDSIGGVPSLDDAGDGGERTEAGGSQGQDEYNRLGHHEAGKAPTRSRERGATGKAYDHVQSEAYSKARIGKRNVVISSDYDHVQT